MTAAGTAQNTGPIGRDPDGVRRHPAARSAVAAWRRLTGGRAVRDADRPTLVACSAGRDSSALAIALATTPARVIIAHVVHDLRAPAEAHADRDAAAELASRLGRPFVETRVEVSAAGGNTEANARHARYAALERLASEQGCRFIATGHHARDQLETLLMRMFRGAGPRGLAGVRAVRPLGSGVRLVRPLLRVAPDQLASLCDAAGWAWRHDATNDDTTRTRAALRARVVPAIESLGVGSSRAADTAELLEGAAEVVGDRARALIPPEGVLPLVLPRATLRGEPTVVLGELFHILAARAVGGDREYNPSAAGFPQAFVIARAVRDDRTDERTAIFGPLRVRITAFRVEVSVCHEEHHP